MAGSQPRPERNRLKTIGDWCARYPCWMLALVTVAALVPFLAKPFNMDDPLFVWAAQQIQLHPGDPYGFSANWYGIAEPMWAATQNPPLLSYYLAAVAEIFGWSETGLHLACLLPAVTAVLGTYRLAKNFCRWPRFAALATLFVPGFLVSSTTVMSDVPMLAFWIWAVVFWAEGIRQNHRWKLSAAGALIALAVLTKYNGICLIPLLAAYGWIEKRSLGRWIIFLLIPVLVLCAHEWLTLRLYGHALFFYANQYSSNNQTFHGLEKLVKALNALTYTGGCFAVALFCAPFLWRKSVLSAIAASAVLFVALALAGGMMAKNFSWLAGSVRTSAELQICFWTVGGVCVLALALGEAWRKRDAGSWLLALWVLGTFVFAAFFYWTINARALLPMAPAVAILIARRVEPDRSVLPAGIIFSIVASAVLSLLAAQADFQLASTTRKSAEQICTKYATPSARLWFEGHWGFQYYMQAAGALPLDFTVAELDPADRLIIPVQNSNVPPPLLQKMTVLDIFELPVFPGFATLSSEVGASFYYSAGFGPLPFAFGRIPPEKFYVCTLKKPAENSH